MDALVVQAIRTEEAVSVLERLGDTQRGRQTRKARDGREHVDVRCQSDDCLGRIGQFPYVRDDARREAMGALLGNEEVRRGLCEAQTAEVGDGELARRTHVAHLRAERAMREGPRDLLGSEPEPQCLYVANHPIHADRAAHPSWISGAMRKYSLANLHIAFTAQTARGALPARGGGYVDECSEHHDVSNTVECAIWENGGRACGTS